MEAKRIVAILAAALLAGRVFGQPFVLPIEGTPYEDWTIVNYTDLMAGAGFVDYRGGTYTYNTHNAIDFTLPNFAAMDAGVAVVAAANGTVINLHDGEPDRCSRVAACATPENFVTIQHANGVVTEYVHLRRNSINVALNQQVVAGQQIGLVGSSGNSTDAHLHFAVFQNGNVVETYQNPNFWWTNPLPYAGDVAGSLDHGVTDHLPSIAELVERPADRNVFRQEAGAGQQAHLWSHLHGIDAGDDLDYYFYRPNGTLYAQSHKEAPETHYGWPAESTEYIVLPNVPDLGNWRVDVNLNGAPLVSDSFFVLLNQQAAWKGGAGDWADANKWADGLPNTNVDAVIDSGDVVLHSSFPGQARDVWLGGPSASSSGKLTLFVLISESGGGKLNSRNAFIGHSGQGSSGAAVVRGFGSVWTNSGDMIVGYQSAGNNTLDIRAGGAVSSGHGFIGDFGGASGTTTVDGTGSVWNSGSELRVGNLGIGTLNVTNGGDVVNFVGRIGFHPSSTGTATVSGGGSTWTNSGDLIVGYQSTATSRLFIQSGGDVSSGRGFIGDFAGASGAVTVDGEGSTWDSGSELRVGNVGTGTLNITNGGDVVSSVGRIGFDPSSIGTVTVAGAGSSWATGGDLIVGFQSTATSRLTIQSGGQVSSLRGFIGDFPSATGAITVEGPGSALYSGSELRIGNFGTGSLLVQNGGYVLSSSGQIGVQAGSAGGARVGGGGARWETNNLTVGGAGTGWLQISSGGTVTAAAGMSVGVLGTLVGEGTVDADVTNHGTVGPGAGGDYFGIGVLTIDGHYTQSSTGKLSLEIFSATNYAHLTVTGNAALSGTLQVEIISDGFPFHYRPAIGESFDLFDWGGAVIGQFDSNQIQLPVLPGSRMWDTSQLYTTGVISVVSSTSPPGDFNGDDHVDAADYVYWRKNDGTQAAFDMWRANFGATGPGAGSVAHSEAAPGVPEPASAALLVVACTMLTAILLRPPRDRKSQ